MKTLRIISLNQNIETPAVGDLCLNYTHGLFFWTQKHVENNVKETLIEYRNTKVVKLAVVETESQEFNEGDEVVTSRWMRETVKSKYPEYNTYRCNTDDYLFESYQLHKAVSFDLTKIYNRVIVFNEDDETTKISLIERNFKSIVAMLQKHSKNGELHITVETKGDSIKLVDGCLVINNYI